MPRTGLRCLAPRMASTSSFDRCVGKAACTGLSAEVTTPETETGCTSPSEGSPSTVASVADVRAMSGQGGGDQPCDRRAEESLRQPSRVM